jgi:hypothetical protein
MKKGGNNTNKIIIATILSIICIAIIAIMIVINFKPFSTTSSSASSSTIITANKVPETQPSEVSLESTYAPIPSTITTITTIMPTVPIPSEDTSIPQTMSPTITAKIVKTYVEYVDMMNTSPRILTEEEWNYVSQDLVKNGYDLISYNDYVKEVTGNSTDSPILSFVPSLNDGVETSSAAVVV